MTEATPRTAHHRLPEDGIPESVHTCQRQERVFRADYEEAGEPNTLIATVRYDDEFCNGHNTLSITADLYGPYCRPGEPKVKHAETGKNLWLFACGQLQEDIRKRLPELAHYLKWHLVSTDCPMYYVENSMYWAGNHGWCHGGPHDPPNLENFRSTAVWPEATEEDMQTVTEGILMSRLPELMREFSKAVESLGFTY